MTRSVGSPPSFRLLLVSFFIFHIAIQLSAAAGTPKKAKGEEPQQTTTNPKGLLRGSKQLPREIYATTEAAQIGTDPFDIEVERADMDKGAHSIKIGGRLVFEERSRETNREFIRQEALKNWKFFEDFTSTDTGLVEDSVDFSDVDLSSINPNDPASRTQGRRAEYTSPTNVGLSLTAVVSAFQLGFIDRADAIRRLSATLNTLSTMDHWKGLTFNWITVPEGNSRSNWVSSVDSGNLMASLLVVSAAFPDELPQADMLYKRAQSAESLWNTERQQYRIGANVLIPGLGANPLHKDVPLGEEGKQKGEEEGPPVAASEEAQEKKEKSETEQGEQDFPAVPSIYHYAVFNSEARTLYYLAAAERAISQEQLVEGPNFTLPVPEPEEFGWGPVEPREIFFGGRPVNLGRSGKTLSPTGGAYYVTALGERVLALLPSWGGSAFETMLPSLFVDEWALCRGRGESRTQGQGLAANQVAQYSAQRLQAIEIGHTLWGYSPARRLDGTYGEMGVSVAGIKGYRPTDVTPHASMVFLEIDPDAVVANWRKLYDPEYAQTTGAVHPVYGPFDAVPPQRHEKARRERERLELERDDGSGSEKQAAEHPGRRHPGVALPVLLSLDVGMQFLSMSNYLLAGTGKSPKELLMSTMGDTLAEGGMMLWDKVIFDQAGEEALVAAALELQRVDGGGDAVF
uniref:DUF3131 domain-containing protein n=1 Tax=Chromera velia CCMP2878 TaxID=1169474 RepID=A0A0G4FHM9_9ALVE|eukprot:Cvel_17055.t1-p1 / transcript=Cvel_17055.t1 / gene=Cvel_17055 / organism=Chromera_velia_CCMP2878 / gene_product=Protein NdvB, putative / transcript_product=Protein NdvB, putative / location=Cvel_scaffold1343:21554-25401(+) / protein_length=685 / sequence_SO=supercontig / SO=protein_coding / is_pseudo=false